MWIKKSEYARLCELLRQESAKFLALQRHNNNLEKNNNNLMNNNRQLLKVIKNLLKK